MCVAGTLVLLLGGCDALVTDRTPERVRNGTSALDLTVSGRPTPGGLAVTERVLARLKARDADGLAGLAKESDSRESDAKRWVARWGDAAQRPATAHIGTGEKDASADIRFAGERATLSLLLLPEDEDDPYGDRYVVALEEG
ncbi:hypothetical protein SUDANB37_04641 [Streptomyces sp. enrichment culture]